MPPPSRRQVDWIKWTLIIAVISQILGVIYLEGRHDEAIVEMSQQMAEYHAQDAAAIAAVSTRLDGIVTMLLGPHQKGNQQ